MKRIFLFTALIFISIVSFSQDIISLKRGKRLEVTVTEITPTLVRYKLFSEPNGRTYFVYKEDVAGILYKNGKVEAFNQSGEQKTENAQPIENKTTVNPPARNRVNRETTNRSVNRSYQAPIAPVVSSPRRGLERGYKGILDWGYCFGAGDNNFDRLYLNFINGAQFNPYFSIGIGVGVHYYGYIRVLTMV